MNDFVLAVCISLVIYLVFNFVRYVINNVIDINITDLFELKRKKNWLISIDKEIEKYNKIANKINKLNKELNIQSYVIDQFIERYNGIYPDDEVAIRIIDEEEIK